MGRPPKRVTDRQDRNKAEAHPSLRVAVGAVLLLAEGQPSELRRPVSKTDHAPWGDPEQLAERKSIDHIVAVHLLHADTIVGAHAVVSHARRVGLRLTGKYGSQRLAIARRETHAEVTVLNSYGLTMMPISVAQEKLGKIAPGAPIISVDSPGTGSRTQRVGRPPATLAFVEVRHRRTRRVDISGRCRSMTSWWGSSASSEIP